MDSQRCLKWEGDAWSLRQEGAARIEGNGNPNVGSTKSFESYKENKAISRKWSEQPSALTMWWGTIQVPCYSSLVCKARSSGWKLYNENLSGGTESQDGNRDYFLEENTKVLLKSAKSPTQTICLLVCWVESHYWAIILLTSCLWGFFSILSHSWEPARYAHLCTLKVLTISSQGGQNESLVWSIFSGGWSWNSFHRAPQKVPAAWNTGHPQWPTQRSIFIPSLSLLTPASRDHFPQKAARSHWGLQRRTCWPRMCIASRRRVKSWLRS